MENGADYQGVRDVTSEGYSCVRWADFPSGYALSVKFPDALGNGDHNYCRNPGGFADQLWCYTEEWPFYHNCGHNVGELLRCPAIDDDGKKLFCRFCVCLLF